MAGLRERRHHETKTALVDAAFELFETSGFDDVTMEAIAARAGVSRSTAYRRFATKEDIVLEIPRRWLAVFDAAEGALSPTASLSTALRETCSAVARSIDGDSATVLGAYKVLDQAPALRSTGMATSAWLERMMSLVAERGETDAELAGLIGGAYLGAIDAMMQHWAASNGAISVADATETLLDRLEPILP